VNPEANGNYSITSVPEGTYTIEVSLSGYTTETISAFSVAGNVTDKDLTLTRRSYTISGTISTDIPGGAAGGADIQLKQSGATVGSPVTTAADGGYTISDVAAGLYTIEVSLTGYTTGTISAFSVAGDVTGRNLMLVKITGSVYTISGRILTSDSLSDVSAAVIQLKQDGSVAGPSVNPEANGNYSITSVPAGTYTIEVSLNGYTTGTISAFSVAGNLTGQNLTLAKYTGPVYTVSGRVSTSDSAGNVSATLIQLKSDITNVGSPVNPEANGNYSITSIPAGTYTIEVSLNGYTTGTISAFSVTSDNVVGKDLTLARIVYTISGTITIDIPGGAAYASVQLKPSGATVGSPVSTAADGTCTISGVLPGTYTIEVSLSGYVTETIPSFSVVAENVMDKNLTLTKAYTISGTIFRVPGEAAVGANVQLKQSGVAVGSPVSTAANGMYTISDVPAGTYTIEVSLSGYPTGTISPFSVTTGNVMGKNLIIYGTKCFVKPSATGDGSGSSWANASDNIQSMIDIAAASGGSIGEVWVATGWYIPVHRPDTTASIIDRNKTFLLKPGVKLYGGFAGTEIALGQRNWISNITILSGDLGGYGQTFNAYHVVVAVNIPNDGATVLDGFTIRGGNADAASGDNISVSGQSIGRSRGGGMYNCNSSPVLTNVTISGNFGDRSISNGGGMRNYNSSPILTNVTISGNRAVGNGGGMYNSGGGSPNIRNSLIWGNGANNITNSSSTPSYTGGDLQSMIKGVKTTGAQRNTMKSCE
jgi:hypothetical protein